MLLLSLKVILIILFFQDTSVPFHERISTLKVKRGSTLLQDLGFADAVQADETDENAGTVLPARKVEKDGKKVPAVRGLLHWSQFEGKTGTNACVT